MQEILDCTIYYQYRGSIDTRPDYKGQEELLKIMFTNLDADITSLYKDGKIISMTGYSSSIAQKMPAVKMDNKLSNVQAAIRTDYKQNKTSIYLGFPLLLNDY